MAKSLPAGGVAPRQLPTIKTLVVKIGSAVLAPAGSLDVSRVERLAEQLAKVRTSGVRVVVVSSGAVATGYGLLGMEKVPKQIAQKQAAAAVGQPMLMAAWIAAFARRGIAAGQALYTADDLDKRARYLNTRRTLTELLARGAVPIVNENDTTSFAEIKLGDNDRLSALTAGLVGADLLLILSTARGLYEAGDARRVISRTTVDAARAHVQTGTSSVGTGGFVTKLQAAETCAAWRVPTVVAGGDEADVITRVLAGEAVGTLFEVPSGAGKGSGGAPARKRWLASSSKARWTIVIDDGAAAALLNKSASLLPGGITAVRGDFEQDDAVEIVDQAGRVVARGLVRYSAEETRQIAGKRASQIEASLGYTFADEVVHRNDLVLVSEARMP